jgi:small-conductance mechanosensitive channel
MLAPGSQIEATLTEIALKVPGTLAVVVGMLLVNLLLNRGLSLLGDKTNLPRHAMAPLRRALRWMVIGSTVVLLLKIVFGVPLDSVWTAFTAVFALIAVGFIAVWSVLSNWLCTLVILITHPFDIGDDIEFAGEPVQGRVVDLNFVFTTLRSKDGAVLQIPNNLFFQKVIKRFPGTPVVSLVEQLNSRRPADR